MHPFYPFLGQKYFGMDGVLVMLTPAILYPGFAPAVNNRPSLSLVLIITVVGLLKMVSYPSSNLFRRNHTPHCEFDMFLVGGYCVKVKIKNGLYRSKERIKINGMWNQKLTKYDRRMLDPPERQLLGTGDLGS